MLITLLQVALLDLKVSVGLETANEFNAKYGQGSAIFIQCDVTDKDQFQSLFFTLHNVAMKYTGLRFVRRCIGICHPSLWSLWHSREQRRDINSRGFRCCTQSKFGEWIFQWNCVHFVALYVQAAVIEGTLSAVSHMREDKGGSGGLIVNIASTAGTQLLYLMQLNLFKQIFRWDVRYNHLIITNLRTGPCVASLSCQFD